MRKLRILGVVAGLVGLVGGCSSRIPSQRVYFLDGAGNLGGGIFVERGLRAAGYQGEFKRFFWTSFLGWGADHLVTARSSRKADKLARQITDYRTQYPDGYICLTSLSAGSSILLSALERLPAGIEVDYVVLFQPSVSATRNLAPALNHVRNRLYATCSTSDAILAAMKINADGRPGPPAGRKGFRVPIGISPRERQEYTKVVNLPWRGRYRPYGWGGGHVTSIKPGFITHVIAPRVLPDQKLPPEAEEDEPREEEPGDDRWFPSPRGDEHRWPPERRPPEPTPMPDHDTRWP